MKQMVIQLLQRYNLSKLNQKIKVIEKSLLKTPLHHALLKSEIEALSQLDCEYIMKLYKVVLITNFELKVFQTSNNTYLITEFCDGGDLGGKLQKSGKYSESAVVSIMNGLVIAYKQLREHGKHSVKLKLFFLQPANILLSANGTPKLADFGFATTPSSPPMLPNVNVGSPLYMSPQALKNNKYSDKSDIWAIGVTAYEILFGQVPWQATSEKELAQRMLTVAVSFPNHVKVSEQCKDFIRRCLIVDESRRCTIDEMERHGWLSQSRMPSQMMMTPAPAQNNQRSIQKINEVVDNTYQSPLGDAQNKIAVNNNVAPTMKPRMLNNNEYIGKENSAQKKSYLESIQKKSKPTVYQPESASASSVLPKRDPQIIFSSAFQQNNNSLEQSSHNKKLYSQAKQVTRQSKQLNHSYQFDEGNLNYQHTQSNEVFQSERNMSSEFQPTQSQQQLQQQDYWEDFKRNDYIVMSQLNFCRYLYRVASLIDKHKLFSSDLLREKMLFFVTKNIMIKIYKLKEMVIYFSNYIYNKLNSNNVLQLANFNQYKANPSFLKITQAVNTYYAKYSLQFTTIWLSLQNNATRLLLQSDKKFDAVFDENFSEFESFYIILNSILRASIHEIDRELGKLISELADHNQALPVEIEGGVVLLDYLVTYFQLSSLILDSFNDFSTFAHQSKIEQIAEGKPVRLTYGHFIEIRNKIQLLEI